MSASFSLVFSKWLI